MGVPSFRTDTLLCDRRTPLQAYLDGREDEVMAATPPPELAVRFGG